jgi:pyrroloquinoline quinone biosynthesis protein D
MDIKPKRKDQLVPEEMDDDLLLADFRQSQLHVLNPTAAAVWEMCDGKHTAEQIAGLIAKHFALPVEEVRQDVARVLGEFREKGLVE